MQSTEKPAVAFDVNTNGQNVEVTPKYNGVADTMHKKKGIAFMRAAEVIADFADNVVNSFKSTLSLIFNIFLQFLLKINQTKYHIHYLLHYHLFVSFCF